VSKNRTQDIFAVPLPPRRINTANDITSQTPPGITNTFDQYLRCASLALRNQQSTLQTINYAYNNASRLQTVTDNTGATAYSATHTYLANSSLLSQIAFKQATTTRMTTTKQYDYLNRLTAIQTLNAQQSTINSYNYQLNTANQRIRSTLADGSYWVYTYDNLGQVISGSKYWSDGSPVAGQQFGYGFDDIGNRQTTAAGGDNAGQNLRSASYSANNLNQYTQRTFPGYVQSLGTANANATVTLWSSDGSSASSQRKGNYFRAELPEANTSAARWLALTNLAVLNNGTNADIVATSVGHQFLPRTPEHFTYDNDGNLTQDGHWNYTWDAENRLVKLAPSTTLGPQISFQFEYDWQGRRIHKQVWANTGWSGTPTNDVKFVYDGWNPIAVLNSSFTLQTSFVWGSDLSGSIQGAGGVGGLLFIYDQPSAIGYSAPAYDGNGNVMALVNMSGGTNCAAYEYGPFGEVLRATGPMAKANPFRFSTKYQDDETDLLYFGYRYYNASTGRWLSRDPDDENGGDNLYAFAGNDSLDLYDVLGLIWKIYRASSGDRALVNGGCGDTVRELAVGIHLDPADYQQWLKVAGGNNTFPSSLDDPVDPYTWFSIPNKVYVNDLLGIDWNIWWQPWKWAEKQTLNRQGFKIVEVDNTLRTQFLPQFSDIPGI
jgi:RHS repeat-associated protein